MTPDNKSTNFFTMVAVLTAIIFFTGRLVLSFYTENNWSYNHWQFISTGYLITWGIIAVIAGYLLFRKNEWFYSLFKNKTITAASLAVITIIFILFQSDNFIYSGGNRFLNQVAQYNVVINHWYEFGSVLFISYILKTVSLFASTDADSGYISLKVFSFAGVILTLIASLKLSRLLTEGTKQRILLFLVTFSGPHAFVYFGFTGIEPVLCAFIYWYLYFALKLNKEFTTNGLLMVFLINAVGIFFHVSLAFLLPATFFIFFNRLFKLNSILSILGGGLIALILLVILYSQALKNFSYARYVLFPEGLNQLRTYSLFSFQHLSDVIELALFFFPQLFFLKFFFMKNMKKLYSDSSLIVILFVIACGNALLVLSEPTHSIILDAPRWIIYLSGGGILLAYLLTLNRTTVKSLHPSAPAFAWAAVIIPLSILPCYGQIETAEKYIDDYMQKNKHFYIEGSAAIQDSYFYQGDITKANKWYTELPVLSEDFMDLTSGKEFMYSGLNSRAIEILLRLKTKYIFWDEPRRYLASIYLTRKQMPLARAEMDTCLMINSYHIEHLINDYRYYRDISDFSEALRRAEEALKIHSGNIHIKSDMAIFYYRSGALDQADSLAKSLMLEDRSLPYPYVISGFISELKRDISEAVTYYHKFIELAPQAPEAPQIQMRIDSLVTILDSQDK